MSLVSGLWKQAVPIGGIDKCYSNQSRSVGIA